MIDTTNNVSVEFADGVRGTHVQRGSRLVISFTSTTNDPLTGPVLALEAPDDGDFTVLSSTCYDRAGEPVDDPGVTIE